MPKWGDICIAQRFGLDPACLPSDKRKKIAKPPPRKPRLPLPPCACQLGPKTPSDLPFTAFLDMGRGAEVQYARTPSNVRHAGQLKLLCSEIAFLNRFKGQPFTVIYAGSAPGLHLPRLARMFPEKRFVLVDPHTSLVCGSCYDSRVSRALYTVQLDSSRLVYLY